jgi:hypothetical protein
MNSFVSVGMLHPIRRLLASIGLVILAACGGGSSDPCGLAATCPPSNGSGGSSPGSAPVVASDLLLQVSAPSMQNNGADTVTATVTAVDVNRNLLPKAPVTITVDNNATIGVSGAVTDENGVVTGTIRIGSDRSSRVITVTATSGSLTRTAQIQVLGARIVASPLPSVVAPGAPGVIRFRLTDASDNPIAGQTVTVSGVGGVDVTGTTDANGDYVYSYAAPTVTGAIDIRASAAGTSVTQTIQVQTTAVPPALPGVEGASLALSASVVPTNSAVTQNRIEVRALFLRETNRPASNVRVRFDLDGNVHDIPGTLTSGTTLVYSDGAGIARTSYVPGDRTSPNEGVTIRACWGYNDFAVGTCPNVVRARLTVIAEPLSVSIGTDNLIAIGPSGIDYVKRHLIQVNDASGAPRSNVQLSVVVDLPRFLVGDWRLQGVDWIQHVIGSCDNEDLNRNRAMERYVNGAVEDLNGNGQLDPRASDVIVSFEGSAMTNAAGQAVVRLTYLPSSASWIEYKIQVVAQGIGGSEGRAAYGSVLPVPEATVISQDRIKPPPSPVFRVSPFIGSDPLNAVFTVNPDGIGGMLCPAAR